MSARCGCRSVPSIRMAAGRRSRSARSRACARAAHADLTVAALLLLVTVLAVGTLGLPAGLTAARRRLPCAELLLHRAHRFVQDPPHRRRRRARRVRGVGRARRLDRAAAVEPARARHCNARPRPRFASTSPTACSPGPTSTTRCTAPPTRWPRCSRSRRARSPRASRLPPPTSSPAPTSASTVRASPCSPGRPDSSPRADRELLGSAGRGARGRRRPAAAAGGGARGAPRRRGRAPARRLPLGGQPQPAHAADRGEGRRGNAARRRGRASSPKNAASCSRRSPTRPSAWNASCATRSS